MTVETVPWPIGVFSQIALIAAALWLAWETKGLRTATINLFKSAEKARAQQIRPFLHISLRRAEEPSGETLVAVAENIGSSLAFRAKVFHYDEVLRKYQCGRVIIVHVKAGGTVEIEFTRALYSLDEALNKYSSLTKPDSASRVRAMFDELSDRSYVMVAYNDALGNLYATKQDIQEDGPEFKYDREVHYELDPQGQ